LSEDTDLRVLDYHLPCFTKQIETYSIFAASKFIIMQSIHTYDFAGKRALIRVDFNVPLDKETLEITDDTRIRAAAPTIKHILEKGGSVVIMSHLGRPKDASDPRFSLNNIVDHTSKVLETEVKFAGDCIGAEAFELSANLQPGQVVMLDNVRYYKHETTGTESFAEQLAKHGDVYVNDAFGTAHRAHASTTVVAKFFPNDKMFGFLIENEIVAVDKVLNSDQKPVTAIVGGAKVSSKITIIERLLDKVDNLIVGGGMAYTFVKASGGKVGNSLVEDDYIETANKIVADAKAKGVNLYIPVDTIIADNFDNDANREEVNINEIQDGWMGLDVGPKTSSDCAEIIKDSKVILWNGPMGVFEMENFQAGTIAVANAIVEATANGAFSLIGGGDSVAAINKYKLGDQVSHVSTGGGAMLEYLEGKELPGIKAIKG
jgi:phosphoglycerate kinase